MKQSTRVRHLPLLILVGIAFGLLSTVHAADRTLELNIVNGINTSLGERVRVTQGDHVILLCTSDAPVQIHLHGYDIEKTITPGTTVRIEFDAHATGRFSMTLHGSESAKVGPDTSHQNNDEAPLFYLEVYPG